MAFGSHICSVLAELPSNLARWPAAKAQQIDQHDCAPVYMVMRAVNFSCAGGVENFGVLLAQLSLPSVPLHVGAAYTPSW